MVSNLSIGIEYIWVLLSRRILINSLFTQIFFTAAWFVYPNCMSSSFVFSHWPDSLCPQIFFTATCFVYPNCISSFEFSHGVLDVFGSLILVVPWVTTMNSPFSLVEFLIYFLQVYFVINICAVVLGFTFYFLGFVRFPVF